MGVESGVGVDSNAIVYRSTSLELKYYYNGHFTMISIFISLRERSAQASRSKFHSI